MVLLVVFIFIVNALKRLAYAKKGGDSRGSGTLNACARFFE